MVRNRLYTNQWKANVHINSFGLYISAAYSMYAYREFTISHRYTMVIVASKKDLDDFDMEPMTHIPLVYCVD